MKSVLTKMQLLATWLLVIAIVTACAPATPIPTSTPTTTSTLEPTPTFTPSPTSTATPQPTPTPRLVSVKQEAVLYSGPGKDGYEEITPLSAGTNVEPLGRFVDFVLVRVYGRDKTQEGYIPAMLLIDVPADLPNLTVDQIPWKTLKNVVLPDKPLEAQNNSSTDWAGNTLVRNLNFLDALMIKLNIESAKGAIGILLSANGAGNPWWKGQKRIEFYYGDGNLHILLRDGTQEQEIYDNYVPLKTISGITTGELILRFDKAANNLQIFQDDKSVFLLALVDVGDFADGLFPNGKISSVEYSIGPNSSGKLTELVFSVPPDGKYK